MSQQNPYNVVAFFKSSVAWDDPAPLYAGTQESLCFQIPWSPGEEGNVTAQVFIRKSTGVVYNVPVSDMDLTCTTQNYFLSVYPSQELEPGIYRYEVRFLLNEVAQETFFSHPFCVDNDFSSEVYGIPTITTQQFGADDYQIRIEAPELSDSYRICVDFGAIEGPQDLTQFDGPTAFAVLTENNAGVGSVALTVIYKINHQGNELILTYVLSYNSSNVSGTISHVLADQQGQKVSNDSWVIIFNNQGQDIQEAPLLNQPISERSYVQKFFLKAHMRFATVQNQESFLTSANGKRYFQSQNIAEIVSFDFWPVADYLATVLTGLQNFAAVTMYNPASDETILLQNPQFSFSPVEGDMTMKGALSYEKNRAGLACDTNFELCP